MSMTDTDCLAAEARARKNIDTQLAAAGWIVQSADRVNVNAGHPAIPSFEETIEWIASVIDGPPDLS